MQVNILTYIVATMREQIYWPNSEPKGMVKLQNKSPAMCQTYQKNNRKGLEGYQFQSLAVLRETEIAVFLLW